MADLTCTCSCSEELLVHAIPDDCNSIDFGYPYLILIQNKDAVNTIAGASPTVAEMEALILLHNQLHVSVIGPLTNGVKSEKSRQERSGADTIDGLTTVDSQIIQIDGKLISLNPTIIADLTKLNCYTRARFWFVTSKGYIWGGKTGFIAPNFWSEWLHTGFGKPSEVPVHIEYTVDRTKDYSATAQDDDYLTLDN